MGRLIDADKFKGKVIASHTGSGVIKLIAIDEVPTAYDPDKVVEQLEEVEKIMTSPVNKDCFGEECRASDCTVCLICKAIEIVKGGGVDAKTDS
jgi:hypothetical protein